MPPGYLPVVNCKCIFMRLDNTAGKDVLGGEKPVDEILLQLHCAPFSVMTY